MRKKLVAGNWKMHGSHPQNAELLAGILAPIALFIVLNAFRLYERALDSANTAYDRMLVTTAYSIGNDIAVEDGRLRNEVAFATLEVYEAGFSTRMLYKISDRNGRYIAGDADLPTFRNPASRWPKEPTLLKVYESTYGSAPVRVIRELMLAGK